MVEVVIPAERVAVLGTYDVVVCGGGVAGISAAVCAARHGAKAVLIERWPFVGGMATAAFVNGWHRSDRAKVVINGLVEELTEQLVANGWAYRVADFPRAYETHWFEPEGMRIMAHRVLGAAGVEVLCYTPVSQPIVEDGRVAGVVVEARQGRRAVLGRMVIDATGDGDVAARAGVPFEVGRGEDGLVQGMTLMYRLRGHDMKAIGALPAEQVERIRQEMVRLRDAGSLPPFNTSFKVTWTGGYINMAAVACDPLDARQLTAATVLATERVQAFVAYFRANVPGFANAELDKQGFSLGIRESRRVRGLKTLDAAMVVGAARQPDAIGHGMWMIDIHDPRGTGHTTWCDQQARHMLPEGQSYHIPLGMCLNERYGNLAVVGRCASSTHEAHSSVRVQTHCMVMGQGVGTCAALALAAGVSLRDVPIGKLQETLRRDGVYLEDVPASADAAVP